MKKKQNRLYEILEENRERLIKELDTTLTENGEEAYLNEPFTVKMPGAKNAPLHIYKIGRYYGSWYAAGIDSTADMTREEITRLLHKGNYKPIEEKEKEQSYLFLAQLPLLDMTYKPQSK